MHRRPQQSSCHLLHQKADCAKQQQEQRQQDQKRQPTYAKQAGEAIERAARHIQIGIGMPNQIADPGKLQTRQHQHRCQRSHEWKIVIGKQVHVPVLAIFCATRAFCYASETG